MSADAALVDAVRRIAIEVAAVHSGAVDREARFPSETLDALRAEGLLSAFVPARLGGRGASLQAIADATFELGRRCASSAMVYAMHEIQVHSIVRHHEDSRWFADYLRRVVAEQRLIASATSEAGTGGDLGRSVAAVVADGQGEAGFEKLATTISYGAYADDLFTTVRRAPDAEPGDQVIVLTDAGQHELAAPGTWDTLGMRGTCSPGATVRARFPVQQILPVPFATVAGESMVASSHLLWAQVWLGIATDAFDRARACVRDSARRNPGAPPPAALRLSELLAELSLLRAQVSTGLRDYLRACEEQPGAPATVAAAVRLNSVKIAASVQAERVCRGALEVCGVAGYRNDSPYSVGRHLRDVMSAPLMIANDRIHQTNASLLLVAKEV